MGKKLYEGKTKIVYEHPEDSSLYILFFKDDITAGDGAKHDILQGKGKYDWETTRNCFEFLRRNGLTSHYVSAPEDNYLVVKKLKMVPLECVTRKIATGSLLKRVPFGEGTVFSPPIFELFLKDDSLHDPFVNDDHVIALKVATSEELSTIRETSLKVFEALSSAFSRQNITLVDLKIEFGRDANGNLYLADDITNNSWRIWPQGKKENMLDKQLYRDGKVGLEAVLEGFKLASEITGKF